MKVLSKKKVSFFVFAMVLTLTSISENAIAMSVKKTEQMYSIGTYDKDKVCTNLGAMCINGSTLYSLKTNSDNNKTALLTTTDYSSSSRHTSQTGKTFNNMNHANGMAYYNGALYVATMNDKTEPIKIVKISTEGEEIDTYTCARNISAITYYENGKFIVSLGPSGSYRRYGIGYFSDQNFVIDFTFDVSTINAYPTAQDIHYEDGFLYIPTSDKESKYKNKILKVNIGSSLTGTEIFESNDIKIAQIDYNCDGKDVLFEIESLDINTKGTLVYCVNANAKCGSDGIYKLTADQQKNLWK